MRSSSVQLSKPYSPVKQAAKKIVKTAVVTTATAGAIAYLGYKGKLNPTEGGNKVLEGVKSVLKKPADFILNKGKGIADTVNVAAKGNPVLSEIIDKTSNAAKTVKGFVISTVETLRDLAEKKVNPEKFGEVAEDVVHKFQA